MDDTPAAYQRALPAPEPPPRDLGRPVRGFDRFTLAILVDRYGEEAIERAVADILASKAAIARAREVLGKGATDG
jgi:hypothetical protein